MESQEPTPQQQLQDLARTRETLRKRSLAPPWYYAVLGVAFTGFTLILLLPDDWQWLAYAASFGVLVLLSHIEARVRGLHLAPRERPWVLLLCLVAGGLLSYPLYALSRSLGPPWVIVPFALLSGVFIALVAWRGDRAFAARLDDRS